MNGRTSQCFWGQRSDKSTEALRFSFSPQRKSTVLPKFIDSVWSLRWGYLAQLISELFSEAAKTRRRLKWIKITRPFSSVVSRLSKAVRSVKAVVTAFFKTCIWFSWTSAAASTAGAEQEELASNRIDLIGWFVLVTLLVMPRNHSRISWYKSLLYEAETRYSVNMSFK